MPGCSGKAHTYTLVIIRHARLLRQGSHVHAHLVQVPRESEGCPVCAHDNGPHTSLGTHVNLVCDLERVGVGDVHLCGTHTHTHTHMHIDSASKMLQDMQDFSLWVARARACVRVCVCVCVCVCTYRACLPCCNIQCASALVKQHTVNDRGAAGSGDGHLACTHTHTHTHTHKLSHGLRAAPVYLA